MATPVHPTPFKQSVIERYTEGGCFRLARELHFMTGRPIARLDDIHSAIFIDDEEQIILDIEGIWKRSDWLDKWGVFCNAASAGLLTITKVELDWMEPTTDSLKLKVHDIHTIAPMLAAFVTTHRYRLTYPATL
jgi:hypothetical protein